MKIAITHTDFRVHWEQRLRALHTYLEAKYHSLFVIEIAGKGSPYYFYNNQDYSGLNWHIIFQNDKIEDIKPLDAKRGGIQALNNIKPDVVLSGAIAYSSSAAALQYCKFNGTKHIVFDDARLTDVPRSRLVNFIKKKLYDCVDAILCPAPSYNKDFKCWGFSDEQVFYGLNVVDNKYFATPSNNGSRRHNNKTLLAVGRQIQKKNFLLLLKVWGRVSNNYSKNDSTRLLFIGEGPLHNDLTDYVRENNISNVEFIPFQTQEQLKELYHDASALVLPSLYGETWGLVVNEAMAAGLPVFVSDRCGCASTLVEHGRNGYTFNPENKEQMAYVLRQFIKLSSDDLNRMGMESEKIIADWDLDRFCQGVWEAIQYVVSNQNKRRGGWFSKIFIQLWNGRYRPV
jgi:glycosyltransferase involved in cell wall biosynthesis